MATSITVAQALAYENDPSTIPAGAVFDIVDVAANIETLAASDISNFASLLNVSSMTATDAPVTFTPGGPEQDALKSTGIHITAEINAQEVIQLDVLHNQSGHPTLVPPDEHVIVVDTAANLESLTAKQLSDLGNAVDKLNASGTNTGNSAVAQIAATDAPAVFSDNQINALGNAGILIVAPPNDPSQNDGTTIITGRGATFDIVWDSSVASAPAEFKTDVEAVFQLYADTYSSPVTLYYHVGYGEYNGNAIGSGFLGRSQYFDFPAESYSSIVSHLTANATSQAQAEADASLPASNPVGSLFVAGAEAQVLGFADAGTSSESNPDGYIGFATDSEQTWNYSADPNQTPVSGEEDFLASVEHEVSEILGRGSYEADQPIDYSVMDLFRFSSAGTRALTPDSTPAYFSINDGTTILARWNDFATGDTSDLGDWWSTTGTYPANAYNDNSNAGIINPFTAVDATLMNVLGYNFTSAPTSPIPLPLTDITLSVGQLFEYLTLDEMSPGSVNAPSGDSYVVIDTAFDIESITGPEITEALAIGVSEFIVDGAIALLQSSDPADDQVAALGSTPFISALTVAQALVDAANPPSVPQGEIMSTVVVADTAANIETLTLTQVTELGTTQFDVSDLSGVGPLIVQNGDTYAVHGAVTADETIDFTGSGGTLEFDDTPGMKGTISGFAPGDHIVLSDIAIDPNGSANLVANNVLDVTENGTTTMLQLDKTQDFTGEFFHLSADSNAGTDIVENSTPCYCRGTLIQTKRGQKRVERLKIGDKVMTKSGVARPIKWIGRRSFAGRFITGRKDILPICIKAGALEGNVPRRDLWISPHHAMYFDARHFDGKYFDGKFCDGSLPEGALIEAKDLVNGASVVQAEHVDKIEYFHIELETHDVIIAEGAFSEIVPRRRQPRHVPQCPRIPGALSGCGHRCDHGYDDGRRAILRAAARPRLCPCRRAGGHCAASGSSAVRRSAWRWAAPRLRQRDRSARDRRLGAERRCAGGAGLSRHPGRRQALGPDVGEPLSPRLDGGRLWQRLPRLHVRSAGRF